jgi:sec-independent protein translocase protein TatC
MIHHIREIQLRLLSVVAVLIAGMIVGYFFYEPLFEFIKAPLSGPLHYMSPAGSFTFIFQICLAVGIVLSLPVAVYNVIMFVQPALERRLSRRRVYVTTFTSLILVVAGAAFGFLLIIPLALKFFSGFQISGLEAIISADEYLRFVVSITITFVLIFQLPLLMSLADYIKPMPPGKMLKFEKFIVLGSIFIALVVPFANDLAVQMLVASPIIILYNVSIVVVLIQHAFRARQVRKLAKQEAKMKKAQPRYERAASTPIARAIQPAAAPVVVAKPIPEPAPLPAYKPTVDGMRRPIRSGSMVAVGPRARSVRPITASTPSQPSFQPLRRAERRLITDMRPSANAPRSRSTPPSRGMTFTTNQIVD